MTLSIYYSISTCRESVHNENPHSSKQWATGEKAALITDVALVALTAASAICLLLLANGVALSQAFSFGTVSTLFFLGGVILLADAITLYLKHIRERRDQQDETDAEAAIFGESIPVSNGTTDVEEGETSGQITSPSVEERPPPAAQLNTEELSPQEQRTNQANRIVAAYSFSTPVGRKDLRDLKCASIVCLVPSIFTKLTLQREFTDMDEIHISGCIRTAKRFIDLNVNELLALDLTQDQSEKIEELEENARIIKACVNTVHQELGMSYDELFYI